MAVVKYSPLHLAIQKLASTRPGAWLLAPVAHHLDALFLRLSRGRRTLSGLLAGIPTVILTSTGAKSGEARTLPLLCVPHEADPSVFALVATNWGQRNYPAWYFNLKAHPQATCSINGRSASYIAHEAAGEEYDRFWKRATALYHGFLNYKERITARHIPIMVMEPVV
jgi:deazaflavin-dependent oxidoreductase (nitroreductase family)